ncbi:MAG: hypothetical protein NTW87_16420 [Planctomycetota bacterium]|nr:hypothetical protein [Planctomycetota bacterium]
MTITSAAIPHRTGAESTEWPGRAKGVAILMVIAVLAGLMALAAPFVLSMVLHGRTARGDLNAQQAQLGAEAATAHALAQLQKNTIQYDPGVDQPEVTTISQLKVTMDLPAASKEFEKLGVNIQNPRGLMWSAKVEDEQGKINLRSTPPVLLGNLLGSALLVENAPRGGGELVVDDPKQFAPGGGLVCLIGERNALPYTAVRGSVIVLQQGTDQAHNQGAVVYDGRALRITDYKLKAGGQMFTPLRSIYEIKAALGSNPGEALRPDEFARIERHVTVESGMAGPLWGHAERPGQQGSGTFEGFSVEKGDGFTPGALIRVVENGIPGNYARVRRVVIKRDGGAVVELDNPIGVSSKGSERFIQPEMYHPININTASAEVLEACVMGVCLAASKDAVRRPQAQLLADFLRGQKDPYVNHEGLRRVLEQAYAKGILTAGQRDAVYINASEPGSPKLRTATVPFCYHSFGSYTIEASGVVNGDAGLQLARHTTRQLLTLPTPWPGRFKIEYQAGMQALLDQGMGTRVVTFPIAMGKTKYKRNAPSVKIASLHSGNVRLDVGDCGPHGLPGEWIEHCEDEKDPGYRQDGYDMSKRGPFILPEPDATQPRRLGPGGLACQPTAVEMWYRPMGGGQCVFYDESLEEDRNRITFSYDPGRGLVWQVFDAGLECQDSNKKDWNHLRRKPVEYIYKTQLDAGEWYHIAGSFKTGRPNGQEIRLDAQPTPPNNQETEFRPGVRLASNVTLTELDSIELEDAGEDDFPKAGAVQIGEEIIEYRQRGGNSLTQLNRGARLSAAAKHESGELVVAYGFSVNLAQDLFVGGATLVERIEKPALTRTRVTYPSPPNKINFILGTETNKLPVDDATNFPKSGFITVGGELLYYDKRTATSFGQLMRGQGDGHSTSTPRNISDGSGVALASIQITDSTQYPDGGIVQIDDDSNELKVEWFAYGSKQVINGKHYLVAGLGWHQHILNRDPLYSGNPPVPLAGLSCGIGAFRNWFGIGTGTIGRESAHEKKAKVIPVVRMGGPHCGHQFSPYGEQGVSEVSIIERGTTSGDLMWVKQAYINQWGNTNNQPCPQLRFTGWGFDFFVGLNDFVSRRYPANTTRVLKWPSGELPDTVGAKRYIGADRNREGQMHGHVDEIKVNTFQTTGARIAMTIQGTGVAAGDEEILLEEHNAWPWNGDGSANLNWPTTGGLVRIEDELMYYKACAQAQFQFYSDVFPPLNDKPPERNKADRRWVNPCNGVHELHPNIHQKTGLRLTNVIRGALGTERKDHPVGAQALLLDGMTVSLLKSNMGRDADTFTLADGRGFPREGYAWFGQGSGSEVVSWLEGQGNTFTGCRDFHGRYGTTVQDHEQDEIVRCLPFRYWDREAKMYDGDGLAYLQAGYAAANAIWDRVELLAVGTEERPRPNGVRPRVLVRFDGNPNWSAEPSNQSAGLYEFRGKDGVLSLRGGSRAGGISADQIEVRVYWEYMPRSFIPNSDWKRTFSIEKLRATYHTPLLMRRLDEIEKR